MKRTALAGLFTRRGQGNSEVSTAIKLTCPQESLYSHLQLLHIAQLTLPYYEGSPS